MKMMTTGSGLRVRESVVMRFREWVRSRRVTDTPRGDFVEDSRVARDFPDVDSWDEMESYLLFRRRACQEAMAEGKRLWREYQRAVSASPASETQR
jgi:hypothetical protein